MLSRFFRPFFHGLFVLLPVLFSAFPTAAQSTNEVRPTPEQVAWAEAELGVIIHLDINIFAPETFDYARRETLPDADVFNPALLDTDQWIRTARAAGAKYAVLTVKHGTGFCLWPSKVNPYNVGHTKWRGGKGDILKDFITSCKKYGVKPGLYYSTNNNAYYDVGWKPFASDSARQAYKKAVLAQLTEIWGNYGPLFEIWFDGGIMDDLQPEVLKLIREKQPQAILFQGPASAPNIIRWVGNEDGVAAYPQWSRTNETTQSNGLVKMENLHGNPDGRYWCPAESDFPNRKHSAWNGGWLWHAGEESHLFSVDELVEKYYTSVGRNTNMLIGMVIDTRGLVPKADSTVFDQFGRRITGLFAYPLVTKANVQTREVELAVPSGKPVSRAVIAEDITRGEHIRSYRLEARVDGNWKEIASGQSVGHKRIETFAPVNADTFRFRVTEADGDVRIKEVVLY